MRFADRPIPLPWRITDDSLVDHPGLPPASSARFCIQVWSRFRHEDCHNVHIDDCSLYFAITGAMNFSMIEYALRRELLKRNSDLLDAGDLLASRLSNLAPRKSRFWARIQCDTGHRLFVVTKDNWTGVRERLRAGQRLVMDWSVDLTAHRCIIA